MLYILQAKLAVTLIQKRLHGQASHYLHSSTSTDNGHLHHINPYHVCPRTLTNLLSATSTQFMAFISYGKMCY